MSDVKLPEVKCQSQSGKNTTGKNVIGKNVRGINSTSSVKFSVTYKHLIENHNAEAVIYFEKKKYNTEAII